MVQTLLFQAKEVHADLEEHIFRALERNDCGVALCEVLERCDYLLADERAYWDAVSGVMFSLPDEKTYKRMRAAVREALSSEALPKRTRLLYTILQ